MTRAWFTISELSSRLDVTPRTIRYYEELGLLRPERQQNRRQYTERDRVRLQLILRGRRLGFSLSEVQEMLDLYAADPSEVTQLRDVLRRGETAMCGATAHQRIMKMRVQSGATDGEVQECSYFPGRPPCAAQPHTSES